MSTQSPVQQENRDPAPQHYPVGFCCWPTSSGSNAFGTYFWGIAFMVLGAGWLFVNAGWLTGAFFEYFWPLLLVALGLATLASPIFERMK